MRDRISIHFLDSGLAPGRNSKLPLAGAVSANTMLAAEKPQRKPHLRWIWLHFP